MTPLTALTAALRADVAPHELTVRGFGPVPSTVGFTFYGMLATADLGGGRTLELEAESGAEDSPNNRLLAATFRGFAGDELARLRAAIARTCAWAVDHETRTEGVRLAPVSRAELRAIVAGIDQA